MPWHRPNECRGKSCVPESILWRPNPESSNHSFLRWATILCQPGATVGGIERTPEFCARVERNGISTRLCHASIFRLPWRPIFEPVPPVPPGQLPVPGYGSVRRNCSRWVQRYEESSTDRTMIDFVLLLHQPQLEVTVIATLRAGDGKCQTARSIQEAGPENIRSQKRPQAVPDGSKNGCPPARRERLPGRRRRVTIDFLQHL